MFRLVSESAAAGGSRPAVRCAVSRRRASTRANPHAWEGLRAALAAVGGVGGPAARTSRTSTREGAGRAAPAPPPPPPSPPPPPGDDVLYARALEEWQGADASIAARLQALQDASARLRALAADRERRTRNNRRVVRLLNAAVPFTVAMVIFFMFDLFVFSKLLNNSQNVIRYDKYAARAAIAAAAASDEEEEGSEKGGGKRTTRKKGGGGGGGGGGDGSGASGTKKIEIK